MNALSTPPTHVARTPLTTAVPDEPVLPLSVAGYHALLESGVYNEEDPVEFLEGWLVPQMPRKPSHSSATRMLRELLRRLLPAGYFADSRDAVTTVDSEPEPDVYVVRGKMEDYQARHPEPAETPLIAEVAESTLSRDRGVKQRIYARAGIPVYWIVNLPERTVEIYTDPLATGVPRYQACRTYQAHEQVPVIIDGREIGAIAVAEILPPEPASS